MLFRISRISESAIFLEYIDQQSIFNISKVHSEEKSERQVCSHSKIPAFSS